MFESTHFEETIIYFYQFPEITMQNKQLSFQTYAFPSKDYENKSKMRFFM